MKTKESQLGQVSLRLIRSIALNRAQTKHSARNRMLANSQIGSVWGVGLGAFCAMGLPRYRNCSIECPENSSRGKKHQCCRVRHLAVSINTRVISVQSSSIGGY